MYWLLCALFKTLIMSKLIRGTFRLPCCCIGSSVSGSPYCDRHLADSFFTVHSLFLDCPHHTMETFSKANRHFHLTTHTCYTYNLLAIASLLFATLSCAFALKLAGWGPHCGTTSPSSSNKTSSKSSLLRMQMLCSTHAANTVVTIVWMFR